jgi:hypothetical protein
MADMMEVNGGSALDHEPPPPAVETPADGTATPDADTTPDTDASPQTPDATGAQPVGERISIEGYPKDENGVPLYLNQTGPVEGLSRTAAPVAAEGPADAATEPQSGRPGGQEPAPAQRVPLDPLHDMLLRLLDAPRRRGLETLQDENGTLERRRAELAALLAAQVNNPRGGGRTSILGGLVGALRPGFNPHREMKSIDTAMAANRGRARMLYGNKYEGLLSSADDLYRGYSQLRGQLEAFNARFEASPKGKAFLRHLDYVANKTGQDVAVIRDRMHDASDNSSELAELRRRANKLYADPEFRPAQDAIEKQFGKLQSGQHDFKAHLESMAANKVPLGDAAQLGKVLDCMEVPDSLLAKPGGKRNDNMKHEFKKLMEDLAETLRQLIDSLRAIFGFGGPRA